MKLAVVFLCLGITCLVDANAGGSKPRKWTKAQAHDAAKGVYNICTRADEIKTCSESERKAMQLCLIEEVVSYLTGLSVTVGVTLEQLLGLLGFAPDVIELVLAGNFLALLDVLDLEAVVTSILLLVEGLCAHAGILLKQLFLEIHNLLGSGSPLPSILYILQETIQAVLNSLIGTALGAALGLIGGVLGGVLGGLTVPLLGG